jgi:hypothetical protein
LGPHRQNYESLKHYLDHSGLDIKFRIRIFLGLTCEKIQRFPSFIDVAIGGLDFEERPLICGGYDINGNFRSDFRKFIPL